jgi:hypothetical protein
MFTPVSMRLRASVPNFTSLAAIMNAPSYLSFVKKRGASD